SNFRYEGEFKPLVDQRLYEQAHELTKLDQHWARETNAYAAYRAWTQYAVALGTGYLGEEWDRTYWGRHGDIALTAYAPDDVTFLQLPKDHDIQKAYLVLIKKELPLALA